jgi:hypothetical protein
VRAFIVGKETGMTDDLDARSEALGKKIEAVKQERDTPTPQELHERAAAKHATEQGTGLNSGKA